MASEQEQKAYDTAVQGTLNAGIEKAAILLKQNMNNLAVLLSDKKIAVPEGPDADKKYTSMAKSLIKNRRFKVATIDGGEAEVSLDDIDKADTAQGGKIKKAYGVDHVNKLLPTEEQIRTMANAVGEGVAQETGQFEFLGGATIMNALAGLVQWIIGFFTGEGKSLTECIADATANNMKQSVGEKLEKLREERPDMASMLSDENINSVQTSIDIAVKKKTGQEVVDNTPTLAQTKVLDIDTEVMRTSIRDTILTPKDGPALATTIATQYKAGIQAAKENMVDVKTPEKIFGFNVPSVSIPWTGFLKSSAVSTLDSTLTTFGATPTGPSDNDIAKTSKAAADTIANSISKTLTNKEFRDKDGNKLSSLNKDQLAAVVADQVAVDLLKDEKKIGFAASLTEKDASGKTSLDNFKAQVSDNIKKGHKELQPVLFAVHGNPLIDAMVKAKNGAVEMYNDITNSTPKGLQTGQVVANNAPQTPGGAGANAR